MTSMVKQSIYIHNHVVQKQMIDNHMVRGKQLGHCEWMREWKSMYEMYN